MIVQPIRATGGWLLLAALLIGCSGPAQPPGPGTSTSSGNAPAAPKRVTLAVHVDTLSVTDTRGRPFPDLMVGNLTFNDRSGTRYAQLAEAVPSTANGLWIVFPDGRMETTWRLREGARWHDGQPLTTEDLLFTARLQADRELPGLHDALYELADKVEALDARTMKVAWKRPSIEADTMFGRRGFLYGAPLPKHLLERPYLEDKADFQNLPYWTTEYTGSGAFRLKEWARSSFVTLEAFPDYVLGKPKIDQIEIKFILDPNTIAANALAGAIDLTADRSVSVEQGLSVRDRWPDGQIVPYVDGWMVMYPQLRAPDPAILIEPQFRRALMHAVDRQELAETLTGGYGPVAQSIIAPDQAEYSAIESSVVKYEHDPRRTTQLLEGMGLTRGPDGIFHDPTGRRISIQIRASSLDSNQKAMLASADAFTRVGIATEPTPIVAGTDTVYEFSFPGFRLASQANGLDGILDLLHSASAPLPERNYRAPNSPKNRGSYVNPDYDAIMDRYRVTIPIPERMQVLGQLVRWQTDLVLVFGLFHTANTVMISNRVRNVAPGSSWNAHEWDVVR